MLISEIKVLVFPKKFQKVHYYVDPANGKYLLKILYDEGKEDIAAFPGLMI